jgi:hypothetical protein
MVGGACYKTMSRIFVALVTALLLASCANVPMPQTSTRRIVREQLLTTGDLAAIVPGSVTIAPDGGRIAYIVRPDSRRLADAAADGNLRFVVVDGMEQEVPYDAIADLRFSPDGRRLAYTARRGNEWMLVVVNGKEGTAYDGIAAASLIFSQGDQGLQPQSDQCRLLSDVSWPARLRSASSMFSVVLTIRSTTTNHSLPILAG